MFVDDLRIIPLEEEEIPALRVEPNHSPLMDGMCVHDDVALRRLPENLRETDTVEYSGVNEVPEHLARTYARQLIHIADHDKPCPRDDGPQKGVHEEHVDHRHLIDDDDIGLQRIVAVLFKDGVFKIRISPGRGTGTGPGRYDSGTRFSGQCPVVSARLPHRMNSEQPVNRHRVTPRRLRHAFCRPSGRCRQQNLHLL